MFIQLWKIINCPLNIFFGGVESKWTFFFKKVKCWSCRLLDEFVSSILTVRHVDKTSQIMSVVDNNDNDQDMNDGQRNQVMTIKQRCIRWRYLWFWQRRSRVPQRVHLLRSHYYLLSTLFFFSELGNEYTSLSAVKVIFLF